MPNSSELLLIRALGLSFGDEYLILTVSAGNQRARSPARRRRASHGAAYSELMEPDERGGRRRHPLK